MSASQQNSSELPSPRVQPLSIVSAILGECLCDPFPLPERSLDENRQFIQLRGIEFITLGAVVDELSAKQRIQESVHRLISSQGDRLINIGLLLDDESNKVLKTTKTIPLYVWAKSYPNDNNLNTPLQRTINSIKRKEYSVVIDIFTKVYEQQKAHPARGVNKYLMGITAHNIAIIHVVLNREDEAVRMFQQALSAKRMAFGESHPEVAVSLDELGTQYFAQENFHEALKCFGEAKKIRVNSLGVCHPDVAKVLNNIACCNFLVGNYVAAVVTLKEARDIQKSFVGSPAKADLDLLHVATTLCNIGYMQIRLKQYDNARCIFEEALLIQQSVYGDDNNKAIKDTLSNMEFTNAFHF